jgi:hypothetical protein
MKNYLKVLVESRGDVSAKWVKGKSFEEIVEMGKVEYNENINMIMEDGDSVEDGYEYVEEFCDLIVKKDVGVLVGLNEEESVCYYVEDVVEKLKGVDLEDEKNIDLIMSVEEEVVSLMFS